MIFALLLTLLSKGQVFFSGSVDRASSDRPIIGLFIWRMCGAYTSPILNTIWKYMQVLTASAYASSAPVHIQVLTASAYASSDRQYICKFWPPLHMQVLTASAHTDRICKFWPVPVHICKFWSEWLAHAIFDQNVLHSAFWEDSNWMCCIAFMNPLWVLIQFYFKSSN